MSNDHAISDGLLARLRALYGADLGRDGVEAVAAGFLSRNYVLTGGGERFFLKRYRFDDAAVVRTIHRVKSIFSAGGFPVVRPVVSAAGETLVEHEDGLFTLFPFVDGRAVNHETATVEEATSAGEMLGRMHRWGAAQTGDLSLKPVSTWSAKKFLEGIALVEERLAAVESPDDFDRLAARVIARRRELVTANRLTPDELRLPPPILTHGDYHFANLFFADGRVNALFDFEKAEYVSSMKELARAVMLSCLNGRFADHQYALARAFVAAYREANPVTDDQIAAGFRAYLTKLAYSLWVLNEHYLNGNRRVDVFLDVELAMLEPSPEEIVRCVLES